MARIPPATTPEVSARFLDLCVHELRAPTSVLTGYVQMLLGDKAGEVNDKQRQLLQAAQRSCGRLADLVNQLNELAAFDKGDTAFHRGSVAVSALLDDAVGGEGESVGAAVRIVMKGSSLRARVDGDIRLLREALSSLLACVRRETVDGGLVDVECTVRAFGGRRRVLIGIGDTSLFKRLFTHASARGEFDEWRGGVGFSLPIVRRIIEAHGGQLWSPRRGEARGTLVVALPMAVGPASRPRRAAATGKNRRRALLP